MLGIKLNGRKKDAPDEREQKRSTETPVVKVIEVIGTSKVGFDDAIASAVRTAAGSLRHITGADVRHMTLGIADGRVTEYRVDLKIAFGLEADDEDD